MTVFYQNDRQIATPSNRYWAQAGPETLGPRNGKYSQIGSAIGSAVQIGSDWAKLRKVGWGALALPYFMSHSVCVNFQQLRLELVEINGSQLFEIDTKYSERSPAL